MQFQIGHRRTIGGLEDSPRLQFATQIGKFGDFRIEPFTRRRCLIGPIIILGSQSTRIDLPCRSPYLVPSYNDFIHIQRWVGKQNLFLQLQRLVRIGHSLLFIFINTRETSLVKSFQFSQFRLRSCFVKTCVLSHVIISFFDGTHIQPSQRLLQVINLHRLPGQLQETDDFLIQRTLLVYLGYLIRKISLVIQQRRHRSRDVFLYRRIVSRDDGLHVTTGKRQKAGRLSRIFFDYFIRFFLAGDTLHGKDDSSSRRTVLQTDFRLKASIFFVQRHHNLRVRVGQYGTIIFFALHSDRLAFGVLIETQPSASIFLKGIFQVVQPN